VVEVLLEGAGHEEALDAVDDPIGAEHCVAELPMRMSVASSTSSPKRVWWDVVG
jgi:hypothetical protein